MDKQKFAAALVATAIAGTLTVIGAKVTAGCLADALNVVVDALKKD